MKLFRLTRREHTLLVGTVDGGDGVDELVVLARLREPGDELEVWTPSTHEGVMDVERYED